ncbi:MAG: methyltransferase [Chitinophagales bacterium]
MRKIYTSIYQPVVRRRIHRTTFYTYRELRLRIPPGVFHPGYFYSTRLLLEYIKLYDLQGKRFLELGAGSGLISFVAAKAGARVTAIDINPAVIENLHENARTNRVEIEILHSDLFSALPGRIFDHIVINPPYYPKNPKNSFEQAWYCGEDHAYFRKLFPALRSAITSDTHVDMVLSESCDLQMIENIAAGSGIQMKMTQRASKFRESHFIFELQSTA